MNEPTVRDVVARYLERDGYRTLQAASGDEAQRLLQREPPELVVLDVMLPGLGGLELCRWIRSGSVRTSRQRKRTRRRQLPFGR
jgi:DNA-binding response OmpR family regulator